MFEKEAEIYALSNFGFRGKDSQRVLTAKIDYQYGAEFGYNKANEWHYVKDGKPKDNEYVLIYTDIKNVYIARLVEDDYFITNKGGFVQMSAVIAWKEIVLPKESK
jgi:hypothetical protein